MTSAPHQAARLGLFHCSLTGAITLGLLFLLMLVSEAIASAPVSSGALIFLTQQSLSGPTAASRGLAGSIIIGAFAGLLLALTYNLLGVLLRRFR